MRAELEEKELKHLNKRPREAAAIEDESGNFYILLLSVEIAVLSV